MKRLSLLFIVLTLISGTLSAQVGAEAALAEQYYLDGEYESALELFEKVHKKGPQEKFVIRIVGCHEKLGQFDKALQFLDKEIKRNPNSPQYAVYQGRVYEKVGDFDQANALFEDVIQKQLKSQGDYSQIGALFYKEGKLDEALSTYQQGRKKLKASFLFATEIANIHFQQGEYEKATNEYLNDYYENPNNQSSSNMNILYMVNDDSREDIERALIQAIDRKPSDKGLRTILFEFYVMAEDFYEAFTQVKSLDKFFKEDGNRVYKFAETMRNSKKYTLSNKAYDYIIEKKKESRYFYLAHIEKAVNSELKAFDQIPYDTTAIREAVMTYETLLEEFGRQPQYFNAIYRRSNLLVFYLFDLQTALTELNGIVDQKIGRNDWAKAKLLIGDILLMQKEYNKAKLTYTEVENIFKDRQIGALSKYKLAQLSYYKGDFEYSQARLGSIKDNTSNDISNDAIKLNLLIMDNTGLDSTTTALEIFASAQLLVYQRNFDEALSILDSLAYNFPNHPLSDEILWEKVNVYIKLNDVTTALGFIDKVLESYKEDIYGDDALYTKARIYDYTMKDHEQALKLYISFLSTFPGSLYSVEVRKRVRELRKLVKEG